MSKSQKLIDKLQSVPTPSDIRWSELTNILSSFGYELLKGKGSRRKFYNKTIDRLICCHEPHKPECVDKGCVDDVVEHLRENGLI